MSCINHPGMNGLNTCCKCGEWLCHSCSIELSGQIICKHCVAHALNGRHSGYTEGSRSAHRYRSGLVFALFTCILPGLNYMYIGLIKRGLFVLSAFFLTVFSISILNVPSIGLLIPIIWITSSFDANEKRRRLNAGAYVPDSVDDFVGFYYRYKIPLICLGLVAVISGTFRRLAHMFLFGPRMLQIASSARFGPQFYIQHHRWAFSNLTAIVIICVGVYFILKAARRKKVYIEDKREQ